MNQIALFTVVYPSAAPYIPDFIESLSNSTIKNFDLIIVNDGYSFNDLSSLFDKFSVTILECGDSISENRSIGINYVIDKNYKYLFLCDIDDYIKPNRIEKCLSLIEGYDIIVNDLDIVSSDRVLISSKYFSKSIHDKQVIDIDFIKDKNIFGFSNTVLKVSSLGKVDFPDDLKIVDWYYFTLLLNKGLKALFIPDNLTEYRQHSGNMIGISSFSIDMFLRLLKLKIKHYEFLMSSVLGYDLLYDEMKKLSNMNVNELEIILQNNTNSNPTPLWWENIHN